MRQLTGTIRQVEELTKANFNLTTELTALRERVDKAKADAMEEFKNSQPFFNELGVQYSEGFEGFRKQTVLLFPGLDFSSIQIDTTIPITPGGGDGPIDVEDKEADDAIKGETVTLVEKEANGRPHTIANLYPMPLLLKFFIVQALSFVKIFISIYSNFRTI